MPLRRRSISGIYPGSVVASLTASNQLKLDRKGILASLTYCASNECAHARWLPTSAPRQSSHQMISTGPPQSRKSVYQQYYVIFNYALFFSNGIVIEPWTESFLYSGMFGISRV